MNASLNQLLDTYGGRPLDVANLPQFDQDALQLFTSEEIIDNPFLDFTFQHDITQAEETFSRIKAQIPHASFTAYLVWASAKSIAHGRI